MWILFWPLSWLQLNETLQVIYQSKYVILSIILLYCSNCLVTAILLLLENILEVVCFAQWRWIKVRYLVTQLYRWNEYTMGKSAGKMESSQKQNCNILTQLSGICKVLCPTFYLHTRTYIQYYVSEVGYWAGCECMHKGCGLQLHRWGKTEKPGPNWGWTVELCSNGLVWSDETSAD